MVESTGIRASCCLTKAPENQKKEMTVSPLINSMERSLGFFSTHHRLSFLVKEGYFVLALESTGGKYFGNTSSVKISGLMITNDRPCGSHEITSDNEESERISTSLSGKISRFFDLAVDF
jgi:hypothetical protein